VALTPALEIRPRICVIAQTKPDIAGAAEFNTEMVAALREHADVELVGWRRLYPTVPGRTPTQHTVEHPDPGSHRLSWTDPRSWRAAVDRIAQTAPEAVVLPWVHPVMAPPYRYLLRHMPRGVNRIVICHNVLPHERTPLAAPLTRSVLRHADTLVTHAPQQRAELLALGLGGGSICDAYHPRFHRGDAPIAARERDSAELRLLCFGAVRPYKGVEDAIHAMAMLDPSLPARLVVAGRFWGSSAPLARLVEWLGVADRVELRDGYVPDDQVGRLFDWCDAVILPYRSATQSGVVQLAFAHGRPVIATAVGGLPAAIRDGVDGILCPARDPAALTAAIGRMAAEHTRFARDVDADPWEHSFDRYAQLLASSAVRVRR
jgi:glycosyltransferase involved in cell wall biosynthesis